MMGAVTTAVAQIVAVTFCPVADTTKIVSRAAQRAGLYGPDVPVLRARTRAV